MRHRIIEYTVILKPIVEKLVRSESLLLDAKGVAAFLGVRSAKVQQLAYTDRLPAPMRLGLGKTMRWSVLELLDWVAAGCPRRSEWIDMNGWSGWVRR